MTHWGYVIEQIVQGDEKTREAQRHHRQRRDAALARPRWWQLRSQRDQRPADTLERVPAAGWLRAHARDPLT